MGVLTDAMDDLVTVGSGVDGLHGYRADQLGQLQLPAFVVGVPTPRWEAYCGDPTSAAFPVTILARLDSSALEALLEFVLSAHAAIEAMAAGPTASTAVPTSYDLGGGVVAAAYEFTVEYPL